MDTAARNLESERRLSNSLARSNVELVSMAAGVLQKLYMALSLLDIGKPDLVPALLRECIGDLECRVKTLEPPLE